MSSMVGTYSEVPYDIVVNSKINFISNEFSKLNRLLFAKENIIYISLVISIAAVIVTFLIAKQQKNISLLSRRLQILSYIDDIIEELSLSGFYIVKCETYKAYEVRIIFDKEVEKLYMQILTKMKYCNELFAGAQIADKEGNWMVPAIGKLMDSHEIMKIVIEESNGITQLYEKEREKIYKKYIKIGFL